MRSIILAVGILVMSLCFSSVVISIGKVVNTLNRITAILEAKKCSKCNNDEFDRK